MRARGTLSSAIAGRLPSPDGRSELARIATRLILEEAMEAKDREAPGRDHHARGADDGQVSRNGRRTDRLKTAEGAIEVSVPQIAGRAAPVRSNIRVDAKGRAEAPECEPPRKKGAGSISPQQLGWQGRLTARRREREPPMPEVRRTARRLSPSGILVDGVTVAAGEGALRPAQVVERPRVEAVAMVGRDGFQQTMAASPNARAVAMRRRRRRS